MLKILTEAGGEVGYGHFGRCLPILRAAKQRKRDCQLLVEPFGAFLHPNDHDAVVLLNWVEDANSIDIKSDDIVIIDSLKIQRKALDSIRSRTQNVFVIDDIGNPLFDSVIRIDWSIASFFKKMDSSENLISPKYVPLRDAFGCFPIKEVSTRIDEILVTFGGSDVRNMSPTVANTILTIFPNVKVTVLVGGGFECVAELDVLAKSRRVSLLKTPSDDEIKNAMERSDIAVATGGHTIFELAAAGLPTVHMLVAENQIVSEAWKETGFTRYIGWYSDPDVLDKMVDAIKSFQPYSERMSAAIAGQSVVKGNGAGLIIDRIEDVVGK